MTHTPGPWRVHSEHADRIIVNGCCVYQVRELTTEDGPPNPADVRLMSMAPAMLKRLRDVAQTIEDYRNDVWDGNDEGWEVSARLTRELIAKAEGRE